MSELFKNQGYDIPVAKHPNLPLLRTYEFDFYRCVTVAEWVYYKTVSELHRGNLKENNNKANRYSQFFPNQRISYWADSARTAVAEIKKHGSNKNYLTFHAYDDASSTFPMLGITEPLIIINGDELGFSGILEKSENNSTLSKKEKNLLEKICAFNPDCLAFESKARSDSKNFLFFEKGFNKLALKNVTLYWRENKGKNRNRITCAVCSDYSPLPKEYGKCFSPIAQTIMDDNYLHTKEYLMRKRISKEAYQK